MTEARSSLLRKTDWALLAGTAVASDWLKCDAGAPTASEAGRAARDDGGRQRLRNATIAAEQVGAGREGLFHVWLQQRDHRRLTFDLSGPP